MHLQSIKEDLPFDAGANTRVYTYSNSSRLTGYHIWYPGNEYNSNYVRETGETVILFAGFTSSKYRYTKTQRLTNLLYNSIQADSQEASQSAIWVSSRQETVLTSFHSYIVLSDPFEGTWSESFDQTYQGPLRTGGRGGFAFSIIPAASEVNRYSIKTKTTSYLEHLFTTRETTLNLTFTSFIIFDSDNNSYTIKRYSTNIKSTNTFIIYTYWLTSGSSSLSKNSAYSSLYDSQGNIIESKFDKYKRTETYLETISIKHLVQEWYYRNYYYFREYDYESIVKIPNEGWFHKENISNYQTTTSIRIEPHEIFFKSNFVRNIKNDVPYTRTLGQVDGLRYETISRSTLVAIGSPQVFKTTESTVGLYNIAVEKSSFKNKNFTFLEDFIFYSTDIFTETLESRDSLGSFIGEFFTYETTKSYSIRSPYITSRLLDTYFNLATIYDSGATYHGMIFLNTYGSFFSALRIVSKTYSGVRYLNSGFKSNGRTYKSYEINWTPNDSNKPNVDLKNFKTIYNEYENLPNGIIRIQIHSSKNVGNELTINGNLLYVSSNRTIYTGTINYKNGEAYFATSYSRYTHSKIRYSESIISGGDSRYPLFIKVEDNLANFKISYKYFDKNGISSVSYRSQGDYKDFIEPNRKNMIYEREKGQLITEIRHLSNGVFIKPLALTLLGATRKTEEADYDFIGTRFYYPFYRSF